jgi:integrase
MRRWCERGHIEPPFTAHDLRRTFSTRLNGLGVMPQVVEKLLNHVLEGVLAVYNLHEYALERAAALELWTKELERIILCSDSTEEISESGRTGDASTQPYLMT